MSSSVIGRNLRRLRGKTSRASLARLSGLHPMAIAKIERGERRDPKLSTLRALAKALGCDLTELLSVPSRSA